MKVQVIKPKQINKIIDFALFLGNEKISVIINS